MRRSGLFVALFSQLLTLSVAHAVQDGKSVDARANADILMFGHFDVRKDAKDPSKVQVTGGGFCTGTMISPTTILTAAHCVVGEDGQGVNTEFFIQPEVDMFGYWLRKFTFTTWSWPQLRKQIIASKLPINQAKNVIVLSGYPLLKEQIALLSKQLTDATAPLIKKLAAKQITVDELLQAYTSPEIMGLRAQLERTSAIEHAFDVALVVLDEKALAPYRPKTFRKISLDLPKAGQEVTAYGYGLRKFSEQNRPVFPRLLQAGELEASAPEKILWNANGQLVDLSDEVLEATVGAGGHDSQVLPGDSGGPVLDSRGTIVALNDAIDFSLQLGDKKQVSILTKDYFTTLATPLKRKFFDAATKCHTSQFLGLLALVEPKGTCATIPGLKPLSK